MDNDFGTLVDYQTGETVGPATEQQHTESVEASQADGGPGVIEVDGVACYVED